MKLEFISRSFACGSLVALALLSEPSARSQNATLSHYKLFDLGTFGGPTSVNRGIYSGLNNSGTVIGIADTRTPDPLYPHFNPLIEGVPDPYIFHSFQWQDDLSVSQATRFSRSRNTIFSYNCDSAQASLSLVINRFVMHEHRDIINRLVTYLKATQKGCQQPP
jgi:hypothetical protein